MLDYLGKPVKYEALFKKYSGRKFMKGAIFVKDWMERQGADYRLEVAAAGAAKTKEAEKRPSQRASYVSVDSSESSEAAAPSEEDQE
jgi:hypothetical protein